ncbi:peptidoglycan-binding domain-containing protein [Microcoleus sp. BROC3]|uniref:peptidoglycan-binding domain-containing protein n=1 Tax=Microcoleus sp. BROC3 TaxID=3055323 RepID=UPI002FD5F438
MALLSVGSSGSEVRSLQEKLGKLGFFSSAPSGSFDTATESAVKSFQTQRPWLLIDGVVGPMTLGEIDDSILDINGKVELEKIANGTASLSMDNLKQNKVLSIEIQKRLRALGLYPGGKLIDGDFGSGSQEALKKFCSELRITISVPFHLDSAIAQKIRDTKQIPSVLTAASTAINFLISEFQRLVGANDAKLGFLDMGAAQSPFKHYGYRYPQLFEETKAASFKTSSPPSLSFSSYPNRGQVPVIDTTKLSFLDPDITEACICLGNFESGNLTSSWLGRKAIAPVECLSATKIIPILNVLCQLGNSIPANPNNVLLKNQGSNANKFELPSALIDICSYRISVPHSNALSATLNSFEDNREAWIKEQTGNSKPIKFGGKYGIEPTIRVPELRDQSTGTTLLLSKQAAIGGNSISVYDLTRFISLVGWHLFLSSSQQLPNISQQGLNLAIIAMGTDTARYVDTAISILGLENVIDSPIVISKLGFGDSALIYTAFVQFIDRHDPSSDPKLRSFALTLRAAKTSTNAEAIRVDSSIALAVTEIIRRIVTEAF